MGSSIYDTDELYECPECLKPYRGNWIQRHLVKAHGYMWWDNERVMKPQFYQPKVATPTTPNEPDKEER